MATVRASDFVATDWTVTYCRSGSDYLAAWRPSDIDAAYLAFSAANLCGDVDAMRTAAHVIEDGRA